MKREVLWSLRVLACAALLVAGTAAMLAAQGPQPYEARSPGLARTFSILGTTVPLAASAAFEIAEGTAVPLVFGGLVLGPLLGYVYAGEAGRGMARAGIRAMVIGGTVGAAFVICSGRNCDLLVSPGPELVLAMAVVATGGVMMAVLVGRDIIEVGDRVRSRNRRLAALSVRPTYFPDFRTAGLLFTWRH